jgi:hypothetical protein
MTSLVRPTEQTAHGVQKIAGLRRRIRRTAVAPGNDCRLGNPAERLIAGRLYRLQKEVLPLATGRCR